jgi:tetratricopeptide (TPR) repeat protein
MRDSPWRAATLALLLLARALPAAAGQWIKLTSANFELYTSAGEKKGREAILYFEQVRGFFLSALNRKEISMVVPVRIVAFSTEKEYQPYSMNEYAAAWYASDGPRDYIVMRIGAESYPVAVHEFTHLIIRHSNAQPPIWFNEGLAEIYSTLKPVGKKIQIGDIQPGRLMELRDSKWIDLQTLTAVDHRSPYYNEKKRAGVFYAESWALTHMILFSPEYATRKAWLTPMLLEGKPGAEAFQQACGKSLEAVQKDLEHYVRGSQFFAGLLDIRLEKGAETPQVATLSPLESGAVLAGVMALAGKGEQARQQLRQLAKEHPQSWQPAAGLAELAWRERNAEEARTHFARAAQLGADDPLMYFQYAMLQQGEVALLRKALELKPDWQEAEFRLGLALVSAGDYQEAVHHLRRVKITTEQAFQYCHSLAYAYYRLGRKDEAVKYAEEGRKWAKSPGETARLNDLLGYIQPAPPPPAGTPPLAREPAPDQPAPAPATAQQRGLLVIEGTLRQLDCAGDTARLTIEVNGKPVRFAILDPARIAVRNAASGKVDFACGPQPAKPVLLEYQAQADADMGTLGVIRTIEFK